MSAIKLDILEDTFLAVGADEPDHSRSDFDSDDYLGRHEYCASCTQAWMCHQVGRCAIALNVRIIRS